MRKALTAVAVSILMVVLPTTANAITNGQPDGNAHPFVGMLAFYDASGTYMHRCTGTLMSETVVLTASHCTDGTSSARVYFDSEVTSDYRNGQGGIEGTPFTHPNFNPRTLDNDVAVVELDADANVPGPYPTLPDQGFLSRLKRQHELRNDTFVAVGFRRGAAVATAGHHVRSDPAPRSVELRRPDQEQPASAAESEPRRCRRHVLRRLRWSAPLEALTQGGGRDELGDNICRSNDMTQRLDIASARNFLADHGL